MCFKSKNKRVTAILGAGVNLAFFDWNDTTPSTTNITKHLVTTPEVVYYDGSKGKISPLIRRVYEHLCAIHPTTPLDPNDTASYGIMHFERIFHIIEMLDAYTHVWNYKYIDITQVPLFAYFTSPNFKYSADEPHEALSQMTYLIMDFVNRYNEFYQTNKETSCKWYKDFWTGAKFKWDIFNFNYDTTIEHSINCEDGYEEVPNYAPLQKFSPQKLLLSTNNTINHVHGCLLYSYSNMKLPDENKEQYLRNSHDWYKWPSFRESMGLFVGHGMSPIIAPNGDAIFNSPIITGLNKTEKLVIQPFATYRYNLSQKILKNSSIIIAGYSFGDYYVNLELEHIRLYHGNKLRVVLIDKWSIGSFADIEEEKHMIRDFIESKHNSINNEMALFICRVMQISRFDNYEYFRRLRCNSPFISDNGQLMLFIGGIKQALLYKDDIYAFLKS